MLWLGFFIFLIGGTKLVVEKESIDQFSGSKYAHFTKMPITYSLEVNPSYGLSASERANTDEYEKGRIRWAFELLENATEDYATHYYYEDSKPHATNRVVFN